MLKITRSQTVHISDVVLLISGIQKIYDSELTRLVVIDGQELSVGIEKNFAKFAAKLRPWSHQRLYLQAE
jgi:hypothetical protein